MKEQPRKGRFSNGSVKIDSLQDARRLAAIGVVAAGYGGDMPEDLANELLDDIDFFNNKVKCRRIEGIMPKLMNAGGLKEPRLRMLRRATCIM